MSSVPLSFDKLDRLIGEFMLHSDTMLTIHSPLDLTTDESKCISEILEKHLIYALVKETSWDADPLGVIGMHLQLVSSYNDDVGEGGAFQRREIKPV